MRIDSAPDKKARRGLNRKCAYLNIGEGRFSMHTGVKAEATAFPVDFAGADRRNEEPARQLRVTLAGVGPESD
jgi:hypothetical protein